MDQDNKHIARRKFVELSTIGLGGLMIGPAHAATLEKSVKPGSALPEPKLTILCVGAHPGDPEFGCGGTLAKYSLAGHKVTLLYLTRGEAGDPAKSFADSAALRSREAEESCKILNARALFAGQIDANTELNKEKNEQMTKLIQSRPLLETARRVPEPCYAPLNAIVHLFPVSPGWSRLRDSVPARASLPLPRR